MGKIRDHLSVDPNNLVQDDGDLHQVAAMAVITDQLLDIC